MQAGPPPHWKGEAVRAPEQGGHGKGQPSIRLASRLALAASGELGGLVQDQAWLPQPFGSTVGSAVSSAPQGNLFDFLRLTEWRGPRVLYFGDHLYSDLAVRGSDFYPGKGAREPSSPPTVGAEVCLPSFPQDLMLRHGWRTGAIIPELEREIRIINTEQYMHSLTWQQALTGLLERMQVLTTG